MNRYQVLPQDSRFPITLKILIGFLVVLCLSLAANLLFVFQLNRLEGFIRDSNLGAQKIAILQSMLINLDTEHKMYQAFTVLSTPGTISHDRFEREWRDFTGKYRSVTGGLDKGRIPETDSRRLAGLDSSFNIFNQILEEEFQMIKEGKSEQGWQLFQSNRHKEGYRNLEAKIRKTLSQSSRLNSLRGIESPLQKLHSSLSSLITAEYKRGRFFQIALEFESALDNLKTFPETDLKLLNKIQANHRTIVEEFQKTNTAKESADTLFNMVSDDLEDLRESEFIAFKLYASKSSDMGTLTRRIWLIGTFALFLISLFIAVLITTRIAKPISRLKRATLIAKKGKYDQLIPVTTNDEIGELTGAFNEMLMELGVLEDMKSGFVASITHDLKSPLGRIKGGLANLNDQLLGPLNRSQKKLIQMMEKDAKTLGTLIYNLLDLQKIEAGTFKLDYQEVCLADFLHDCLQDYSLELEDKKIELRVSLLLDGQQIMIDTRQMARVIDNLINNAMRFTPPGGKITVEAEKMGNTVRFGIIDTGAGIPPEDIKNIFNKFFQVKLNQKGNKGSGIGLTITKGIIEAHLGKIWVESDLDYGTAFYFELPLKPPEETSNQEVI
ncbi:HAMP domain-containing protein [bacterium]|nr:HAMP domain-containing protein [bacterium]